jgi:membrane protease YdiL (CAAX protease family)
LILLVLPSQIMFFLVPVAAASLSRQPFLARLGLERGSAPFWVWALFVAGTPTVGVLSSLLLSSIAEEMSEQIKLMEEMIRAHNRDFFPGLLVLVAVLPGVVEELMFRGYVQSRLIQRWHPVAAILVSAILFSAAHLDPLHALGVLPLGLWLGLIAWRTGSVLPAIACHVANNAAAVCMSKYGTDAPLPKDDVTLGILAISVPAFLAAWYLLLRRG